ncbi:MAG: OmpA family protein [bacterium]
MGKKKHAEEHENLERWLVSYADFITLLFATFVALYALAQVDLQKLKKSSASIEKARDSIVKALNPTSSNNDGLLNEGQTILDSGANPSSLLILEPILDAYRATQEERLYQESKDELDKEIKKEGLEGLNVTINQRGLVIDFLETLLFQSGQASIKPNSYKVLNNVGTLIKTKFPKSIVRVEGHTDNIPIHTATYPSNWELSAARASSVLRYILSTHTLNKENFSAVGYGDSHPKSPNLTQEGRNANRRVEIVVLRSSQSKFEPKAEFHEPKFENAEKQQTNNENKPKTDEVKPTIPAVSNSGGLSKAALELLNSNGKKSKKEDVLMLKDNYDMQSVQYKNKLKQIENGKSSSSNE